jgi:uncharacterized protein
MSYKRIKRCSGLIPCLRAIGIADSNPASPAISSPSSTWTQRINLQFLLDGYVPNIVQTVLQGLQRMLADKFRLPKALVRDYLSLLRTAAEVVKAGAPPRLQLEDPDNLHILACAIAAKADFCVANDKALIELGKIEEIPILSPRQLWQKT